MAVACSSMEQMESEGPPRSMTASLVVRDGEPRRNRTGENRFSQRSENASCIGRVSLGTFVNRMRFPAPTISAQREKVLPGNIKIMSNAFLRPVTILVGFGYPRRFLEARQALAWLEEQPPMLRDEAFHATRAACRDAIAGTADVAEVEAVLCAYARRRGMLVEDDGLAGGMAVEAAARLVA